MSSNKERRDRILALLGGRGRLRAAELAARLGVTEMTIRRDLAAMEADGLITRVHGGCVLQSPFVQELSFPEKERQRSMEKNAIARAAAGLIRTGSTIYLDTGTTALQLARLLPSNRSLSVFTNNLRVASELFGRSGVSVNMYGGRLAEKNPDLVGEVAVERIGDVRLNQAFLGADAVDLETGGIYGADDASAAISRTVQRQADCSAFLVDSSKFGKRGHARVGQLAPKVLLITDSEIDLRTQRQIRRFGGELVTAKRSPHHAERPVATKNGPHFPKPP